MQENKISKNYADLNDGKTYYEIVGKESNPLVVLVHGFATPSFIWDNNIYKLEKYGYKILRYDLYGRGKSSRENKKYNIELFNNQLIQLLDFLELEGKINILGLSMGGDIASYFTIKNKNRVKKLALISPACFFDNETELYKIIKKNFLGEIAIYLFGKKHILSSIYDDFFNPLQYPEYKKLFEEQKIDNSYLYSLLSTYREMSKIKYENIYRNIEEHCESVLLLWGKEDKTIPYKMSSSIISITNNLVFHTLENCKHVPNYEIPEIVNSILKKYFD